MNVPRFQCNSSSVVCSLEIIFIIIAENIGFIILILFTFFSLFKHFYVTINLYVQNERFHPVDFPWFPARCQSFAVVVSLKHAINCTCGSAQVQFNTITQYNTNTIAQPQNLNHL